MNRWGAVLLVAGLVLVAGKATAAVGVGTSRRASVGSRWAAAGVHPALQALLDAWEREGWFDVEVGTPFGGFPGGGLRTASDAGGQLAACQQGLSGACTLAETPHGRGAALDIWPAGFVPTRDYASQPGTLELMRQFGQWAKTQGFDWGGDWANPDMPHVEMRGWRSLPFPPPNGGYWA